MRAFLLTSVSKKALVIKGFFLIRIQDVLNSNGIAAGFDLPDTDEFDFFVDLSLTKKQTNEAKQLFIHRNQFRYLHKSFDYLTQRNHKHDPAVFYRLPFRIVRFKIGADSYETVVTNLDATLFPAQEIKNSIICVGELKPLSEN